MWLRDSGMHRGLFRIFSGPSPYMGSGLAPRLGPRPQSLHHAPVLPKPKGQHPGGGGHDQRGHRRPPVAHIHYNVYLSDFFTFARAFWAWISGHAFVLPAMLDSRLQSVHADTRQSGQLSTIAVPGRREQGTSGHDRAPGYGQVAVTSTHIPGLQPMDSLPSHAGLLSCLQLRVQSCAIPTTQDCVDGRVVLATQPLGGPGPQRVGRLLHSGRGLGTVQVCEGWASPSSKVLALLSVPSMPGPWGCATQVRMGTQSPHIQPGPRQGTPTAGDMLTSLCLP